MNTSERHLRDELARAADQFDPAAISPESLRERPSHRGRTILLAAAATITVIAAPVAVIEIASNIGSEPPVTSTPTSSPSTSDVSPSPTAQVTPIGRVVIDTGSAPTGPQPQVVIGLYGNLADVPLGLAKGERLVSFAPHGTGWIVLVSDQNADIQTRILGPDGKPDGSSWTTNTWSLARGADGSVAFINPNGDLQLDGPDGEMVGSWDLTGYELAQPVGIADDGTVLFTDKGRSQAAFLGHPDGSITQIKGTLTANGVGSGLFSGTVSISDSGSCGGVFSLDSLLRAWKTCDYTLGHFSPDGRLLIGMPAYLDGIGNSSVSILDATTGQTIVDFEAQRQPWSFISDTVWEDDTHLLATVYNSESGWHVVRLGVDGSVTIADLGELKGGELNNPVVLPAAR